VYDIIADALLSIHTQCGLDHVEVLLSRLLTMEPIW